METFLLVQVVLKFFFLFLLRYLSQTKVTGAGKQLTFCHPFFGANSWA